MLGSNAVITQGFGPGNQCITAKAPEEATEPSLDKFA